MLPATLFSVMALTPRAHCVQLGIHGTSALCSFHAINVVNARALENANVAVIVGAIMLRAVVYLALYWTLPRDKQAVFQHQAGTSCVEDVPELTGKTSHLHNALVS